MRSERLPLVGAKRPLHGALRRMRSKVFIERASDARRDVPWRARDVCVEAALRVGRRGLDGSAHRGVVGTERKPRREECSVLAEPSLAWRKAVEDACGKEPRVGDGCRVGGGASRQALSDRPEATAEGTRLPQIRQRAEGSAGIVHQDEA